MQQPIRIGTRKSKLALWQAHWVADRLKKEGHAVTLVTMETRGDKVLDVSIAKIGAKGVFTKELEDKLANGEIDIAVHSAKDMQSKLPPGFEIIAFSEREKVNDVLVSEKKITLSDSDITIGTSSTRRVAFLRHFYPHIKIVEMRGNLQTRIAKMKDDICDALLLAYAGVHRMGYHNLIQSVLDETEFIPAVGQGCVAIEAFKSLDSQKRISIRRSINHQQTEQTLLAERAYLAELDGGCSIPIFALAKYDGSQIKLTGGIISLDGTDRVIDEVKGAHPITLGKSLATKILNAGGVKILEEIKRQI